MIHKQTFLSKYNNYSLYKALQIGTKSQPIVTPSKLNNSATEHHSENNIFDQINHVSVYIQMILANNNHPNIMKPPQYE